MADALPTIRRRAGAAIKALGCLVSPQYRAALLAHGVAAAFEHEPIVRASQAPLVIDIGANAGQFSLAARRALPRARIHAFEPQSGPAERFKRVFSSDPLVVLHPVAVGPESGTASMNVSRRADSSSLLPITPLQSRLFPGTEPRGVTEVTVRRLAQVIAPDALPDDGVFLKLDVQGFELECLRGCAEILPKCRQVYVEASFVELYGGQALLTDVARHLFDRGFALRGVHHCAYADDGSAVQADLLFVRTPQSGLGPRAG